MNRKTSAIIFCVIIAFTMAMILPGCQQNGTTAVTTGTTSSSIPTLKSQVEITFWNGWTGSDGELLKQLVEYYNTHNKDLVTVKMDIMEHQILGEKMAAALASNTAPNLFLSSVICDYLMNNQFVQIDDIFDKTTIQRSDFVDTVFNQMSYEGHLYGLPFQETTQYMFWNKDLFKAAGLDPEVSPRTYEEIQPLAIKMNDKAKNIIGGGVTYNDAMCYASMAISYGGKIMEGEKLADFKAVVTDPKYLSGNLKAVSIIKGLVDSGCVVPQDVPQNEVSFYAGTMGMLIGGSSNVAGCRINHMNFGVSLLPAGTNGIKEPGGSTQAMVVMKGTAGDKLLATYKFMQYWNDNINNKYDQKSPAYQWSATQGYAPYLKSVAQAPELMADPVFKVTSSYAQYYTLWLPSTFTNFFAVFFDIFPSSLEGIMTGMTTPEEGLQNMQAALDGLIKTMQG